MTQLGNVTEGHQIYWWPSGHLYRLLAWGRILILAVVYIEANCSPLIYGPVQRWAQQPQTHKRQYRWRSRTCCLPSWRISQRQAWFMVLIGYCNFIWTCLPIVATSEYDSLYIEYGGKTWQSWWPMDLFGLFPFSLVMYRDSQRSQWQKASGRGKRRHSLLYNQENLI